MEKKKLEVYKLIERNSVHIEESSKNGIIAHHLDVDGFLDDLFNNVEIRENGKEFRRGRIPPTEPTPA